MLSASNPIISHDKIIEIMTKLGYGRIKKGICNGLAQMWVQAVLCEEKDKFMTRLYFICTDSKLFEKIAAAKAKKGNNLTLEDKHSIDVLAFFDGVQLYQNFGLYTHLFRKKPHYLDAAAISELTLPIKLNKRPIIEIHSENRAFNLFTMQEYLDALKSTLYCQNWNESTQGKLKVPELVISMHSCTHKVALRYSEQTLCWELADANHYPSFDLPYQTTAPDVLNALTEGFITPVNISIFTTQDNPFKVIFQNKLQHIKDQYIINSSDALIKSSKDHHLLTLTAMRGEEENFKKIISEIPNLQLHEYMAPAIKAALYHIQTHIIHFILRNYPDCLLALPNKQWLLKTAIKTHQNSLIKAICQLHADVNEKNKKGQRPLHIAIAADNLEAVKELIALNANINLTNEQGDTPLTYAIQLHNLEVIKFLITVKKLNTALQNGAGDPALIVGAKENSVVACEILLANGASPNIKNKSGETAALIAVSSNNFPCLKLLLNYGADLSLFADDSRSAILLAIIRERWEMAGYILLHLKNLECFNSYSYHLVSTTLKKIIKNVIELIIHLPDEEKKAIWSDIKNHHNALGMMLSTHPKNECFSFFKEKRRTAYLKTLHTATKTHHTNARLGYVRV